MSKRAAAAEALNDRDWSAAQVVDQDPATVTVYVGLRVPRDLHDQLVVEAKRRGTSVSEVVRSAAADVVKVRKAEATVNVADLYRVIDDLAAKHAA